MLAYNHVVVIGVLTRDPEVKTVGAAGTKYARLSLCVNEKRKSPDGKINENPVFIDVDAWSKLAEICEKYLVKNSQVFVEGRLQMAHWEKDGVKRQKVKIRAQNIKFLPRGERFNGAKKNGKGDAHGYKDKQEEPEPEVFVPDESPANDGDDGIMTAISEW